MIACIYLSDACDASAASKSFISHPSQDIILVVFRCRFTAFAVCPLCVVYVRYIVLHARYACVLTAKHTIRPSVVHSYNSLRTPRLLPAVASTDDDSNALICNRTSFCFAFFVSIEEATALFKTIYLLLSAADGHNIY
jgi:hypothetical protein